MTGHFPSTVMAGLVPAIHVFFCDGGVRVDTRDKPGHDAGWAGSMMRECRRRNR